MGCCNSPLMKIYFLARQVNLLEARGTIEPVLMFQTSEKNDRVFKLLMKHFFKTFLRIVVDFKGGISPPP